MYGPPRVLRSHPGRRLQDASQRLPTAGFSALSNGSQHSWLASGGHEPPSLAVQNVVDKPPHLLSLSESVEQLIQRMHDAILGRTLAYF